MASVFELGPSPSEAAEEGVPSRRSYWRKLASHPFFWPGAILVVLVVCVAVFAPEIATRPYWQIYPDTGLSATGGPLPPQWTAKGFLLGTDWLGRDVFSRLVFSARISLQVGIFASVISGVAGLLIGLVSGYFGGWVDMVLMRFTDVMMGFPALFFLILLISLIGPNVEVIYLTMGLLGWPSIARFARGQVLSVRKETYVDAAQASGGSHARIILRHIMPNIITPVVVLVSMSISGNIIYESTLSFLGIGVPDPIPSWGKMVSGGLSYLYVAPTLVIFPILAISVTTIGFNLLAEAFNATANPRSVRGGHRG